jgi:hypothetical protein
MTSLRKDLRLSDSIASVRRRASDAHLSEPISVRRLANEMSPEVVNFPPKDISAGDVYGSAAVAIASNGAYAFSGFLHTKRAFFGDKFTITATLLHSDASGKVVAIQYKDEFDSALTDDPKTTVTWAITGDDNWIENNWGAVKNAGVNFHLVASWHVSAVDIVKSLFIVGTVGVLVLTGGSSKKGCWKKDEAGNVVYRTPCE